MVVLRQGAAADQQLQQRQLSELRAAANGLRSSLAIARASLDQLNLRAAVSGQLTAFSIQVGQSLSRGERLGQIDSPGRNKLVAGVDEFYLSRVALGQRATLTWNGSAYSLKISKISSQVKNGEFEVECQFLGAEPQGVQRGQTMQARLKLGDPRPATLIPNGAFYSETGGAWVFVVTADGRRAEKRTVRLGRRNTQFIEVLEGLELGERVITSPYTGLTDKNRLTLKTG
ncbi:MAG: efflux RND transporter periplasmic adaptor subunit [Hyphomicrobiaceae bacterium]|nr:efflux RND transporter periplasmic adaptor subunit [Hyphomicrobiaceae bacterium]